MVATISTGERRPPSPVPLSGLRKAGCDTTGIRSMLAFPALALPALALPPQTLTREKRR